VSLSFITDVGYTNIISVPICLKWYMVSQPIFNRSVNDVAWKRCYAVGSGTKSAKHHFTGGLETLMNETVGTVWLVWLREQKHLLCPTDGMLQVLTTRIFIRPRVADEKLGRSSSRSDLRRCYSVQEVISHISDQWRLLSSGMWRHVVW
jgi:hypothetical protein